MHETPAAPPYEFSDKDFSNYLTTLKEPKDRVLQGLAWFEKNFKNQSEGVQVLTQILNNARAALNLPDVSKVVAHKPGDLHQTLNLPTGPMVDVYQMDEENFSLI